jgi:hypothetical protein
MPDMGAATSQIGTEWFFGLVTMKNSSVSSKNMKIARGQNFKSEAESLYVFSPGKDKGAA